MKRATIPFTLLLLIFAFYPAALTYAAPAESTLDFAGFKFYYHASHSLTSPNVHIDKAIFVTHGSALNADAYYDTMELLAKQAGKTQNTLIISPHFKEPSKDPHTQDLVWDSEGWLKGDPSLNGPRISSFDILDHIFKQLADPLLFPNLKTIVVTGHSAGGQLTQRYAFGNQIESTLKDRIQFNYFVMNPGSYLYLTKARPYKVRVRCKRSYNTYKYGLKHLNEYTSRTKTQQLVQEYVGRNITYLVGEKDIITQELDNECGARAQGATRLERAQNFKEFLDYYFSENQHPLYIIPGIGHTQRGMYASETVSKLIFP